MKHTHTRTHRIYYDEENFDNFIRVPCDPYRGEPIQLCRARVDVLRARQGCSISCMDARMVKRLQDVFPFPVHIVEFNTASCYIVDKVSHGVPAHAIQFSHNDGAQINHHDRLGIDYILYNGLEVQEVILSAPAIRSGGPKKLPDPDAPKRPPVTRKRALVYGARRRAALAGIHLTNR